MITFSIPTEVQIGDASQLLSDLNGKRILIVCDSFLANSENLKEICHSLSSRNKIELFAKVKPDPTAADIAVGIRELQLFKPNTLIAYGGGSAIDLAKAINHTLVNFGYDKLSLIAIPTTSGTGSEVTNASVISIPEKNQKIPLFDRSLLPDRAILDAKQTFTVPAQVTVATGIDVLTHAVEAIVGTNASHFSDALAEKAAALVFQYLVVATNEPNNEQARSGLLNASCLAGIAFNHAGLGLAHAIAHQIGATMHVPHGRANGLVLLPVIRFNSHSSQAAARYARLARILGFASSYENDLQCVERLIEAICRLYELVGFDVSSVVDEAEKQQHIQHMTDCVLNDITLTTNPIQPKRSCVEAIIASL